MLIASTMDEEAKVKDSRLRFQERFPESYTREPVLSWSGAGTPAEDSRISLHLHQSVPTEWAPYILPSFPWIYRIAPNMFSRAPLINRACAACWSCNNKENEFDVVKDRSRMWRGCSWGLNTCPAPRPVLHRITPRFPGMSLSQRYQGSLLLGSLGLWYLVCSVWDPSRKSCFWICAHHQKTTSISNARCQLFRKNGYLRGKPEGVSTTLWRV